MSSFARLSVGVLLLLLSLAATSDAQDFVGDSEHAQEDEYDRASHDASPTTFDFDDDEEDGSGGEGGCTNTCLYPSDLICDDGGEGSHTDQCDFGTDCDDCGPRDPECPLRDGASDVPQHVLSDFTIDRGTVTIIFQQEYEWGKSTPNLIGMEACADAFQWSFEPSVVPCDYLEWQGTIRINALLDCNYTVSDSATTDVTIARVDLAFKTSRDVNVNLVGNGEYNLVTTKTTSWPLLFKFQKNIEVKSDAVSLTTLYVPQTPAHTVYHFLLDAGELDDDLDDDWYSYIKLYIADKLNLQLDSILDFEMSLSSGRSAVDFKVLGDWITDIDDNGLCDAPHLEWLDVVDGETTCKLSQVLLSLNVVTKREVLTVGPDLIPTATIGVFTAIQYPFVLVNPIHKNKDPALEYANLTIVGSCSVDTDCTREIEWSMRDEQAKCTFTGSYEVELEVQCNSAFTSSLDNEGIPLSCPLAGGETVTLTVELESGNHCPDTAVSINLPATSLYSTRGPDRTSSFLNTQTMDFHANVRADDAGLQQAFFTEIAVENLDSDQGPQQLYSKQQYLTVGNKLDLSVVDVDETDVPDGTDPLDPNSFLTPRFSFVADAAELSVALSETALLVVTATIEVVFQAGGSEIRRRFLLQARSGDASVQTQSNILLGGSAPVDPAPVVYNSAMRSGSSTVVVAFSLCAALLVHFV